MTVRISVYFGCVMLLQAQSFNKDWTTHSTVVEYVDVSFTINNKSDNRSDREARWGGWIMGKKKGYVIE